MAGVPWLYFVPYEADVGRVLSKLRQREFEAGRYFPAMTSLPLVISESTVGPGKQHETPEAAVIAAAGEGTKSILDIVGISKQPCPYFAYEVTEQELDDLFGTTKPTCESVQKRLAMFELIDRGEAMWFTIFDGSSCPVEICFVGYSLD